MKTGRVGLGIYRREVGTTDDGSNTSTCVYPENNSVSTGALAGRMIVIINVLQYYNFVRYR